MSNIINQFLESQNIGEQNLNHIISDLLSSEDDKIQVIIWRKPELINKEEATTESNQEENRDRENINIIYIDNLTDLRTTIISRKEIIKNNLIKLELNNKVTHLNDNNEIIRSIIESLNFILGKNIYQELIQINKEDTARRVNKVCDDWDKWKVELPVEELDKWLWLEDFNILVQEWKIDTKALDFITNLLINTLKVDRDNLYNLCINWVIDTIIQIEIDENILIELINDIDIEKLINLINITDKKNLINLINNTGIKYLIRLINDANIENSSYLIYNANQENLRFLIRNTNIENLCYLIDNTNIENLSYLISNTDINNLDYLIKNTDKEKLSNLISKVNKEKLSNLIIYTNQENLNNAINNNSKKLISFLDDSSVMATLSMRFKYDLKIKGK